MFIRVDQNLEYGVIEIFLTIDDPKTAPFATSISALATWDYDEGSMNIAARINIGWGGYNISPDEARSIADWFMMAAQATETLAAMIKTRDDLKRPIEAEIIGQTVIINFTDEPA